MRKDSFFHPLFSRPLLPVQEGGFFLSMLGPLFVPFWGIHTVDGRNQAPPKTTKPGMMIPVRPGFHFVVRSRNSSIHSRGVYQSTAQETTINSSTTRTKTTTALKWFVARHRAVLPGHCCGAWCRKFWRKLLHVTITNKTRDIVYFLPQKSRSCLLAAV